MPCSGVDVEARRAAEALQCGRAGIYAGASLLDGARPDTAAYDKNEGQQRLQDMLLAVTGTHAQIKDNHAVGEGAAAVCACSDSQPMLICSEAILDQAAQAATSLDSHQQQLTGQQLAALKAMQQQHVDAPIAAEAHAAATVNIEVVCPGRTAGAAAEGGKICNSGGRFQAPAAISRGNSSSSNASSSTWDTSDTSGDAPALVAVPDHQLMSAVLSGTTVESQPQQLLELSLITEYSSSSSSSVRACDGGQGNSSGGGSSTGTNGSGNQAGSSGGAGGGQDSSGGGSSAGGGSSSSSGSSGGDQGDDDRRNTNRQQLVVTQPAEATDGSNAEEAAEQAAAASVRNEPSSSVGCSARDPVVLPGHADNGNHPGNLRLLPSPTRYMAQTTGGAAAAGPGRELSLDALTAAAMEAEHCRMSVLPHELNLSAVNMTSAAVALNSLTDAGLAAAAEGDQGLGLMQAGMFGGSHHVSPLSPATSSCEFPGFANLSGVNNFTSLTPGRSSSDAAAAGPSSWSSGQLQAQQQALQQQLLLLQQQQQLGLGYSGGAFPGLNSGLDQLLLQQISQGGLSPAGSGPLHQLAANYHHQQQQGTPLISPQHSLGIPPIPQQQHQHRPPLLPSSGSAPYSSGRLPTVPDRRSLLATQLHLLNPGLMGLIGSSDPGLAAAAAPGPLALSGSDNLMSWLSNDEYTRAGAGVGVLTGAASESDAAALARAAAAFSNTAAITAAAAAAAQRREKQQQKKGGEAGTVVGGGSSVSRSAGAVDARQARLRDQDAGAAGKVAINAVSESLDVKQTPKSAGGGGQLADSTATAVSNSSTHANQDDVYGSESADVDGRGEPATAEGPKSRGNGSSSLAWLAAAAAGSKAAVSAGSDAATREQQQSSTVTTTTPAAAAISLSLRSSSSSLGAQLDEQLPAVIASSSSSPANDTKPHQDQQPSSSSAAAAAAAAVAAAAAAAVASGSADSNAATAAHVAAAAAALAAVDPGAPQGPSGGGGGVESCGDEADIPEGQPSRHLWLGNIPLKPNRAAMESLFSRFGPLESVRVFPGKTFAFINFVHAAHAITAKAALDGQASPLITGPKPLVIRFQKDTAAVPTAQAAAKALEAAAARARKSLGRTSLTGGGAAALFPGAAAAAAGGSLGDEEFVAEPAVNLSNKLNPNNIHYDRELAARYKRMSKSEKEALWAQDRAMQQFDNNPAAASLLSAAAMAAAAGQPTPGALFESVLQQQQPAAAANFLQQIMSTNPQLAAAAALQQAHGAAAAGLFQQTPSLAAAGWSRSAAYQQAAAAAHAQALGQAALNPATAASAGLGNLLGRMSGTGSHTAAAAGGGGGGGLPHHYLPRTNDLMSNQLTDPTLTNPTLLQQQLLNYLSAHQDPSAALAALQLDPTLRQANPASINTAAGGGLNMGSGSLYPAAAAGGAGGLTSGPHSQSGTNRRLSLQGASQTTPPPAASPVQQQLSGFGSSWCSSSSLLSQLPQQYLCPLTQQVMSDPVVAADGFTYERSAISEWLRVRDCSPVTGQQLTSAALQPNITLRQAIAAELARLQAAVGL